MSSVQKATEQPSTALVLYIHGFLSSPQSFKAQCVERWLATQRPDLRYVCPALPPYPAEAMALLETTIAEQGLDTVYLIGSSLGGFYATYLAEKYRWRGVLVNPAVAPYNLLAHYLHQDLKNYHTDQAYRLTEQHIDELKALDVPEITFPQNLWLMVQTGDETLDYRLAEEQYQGCRQLVEPGGDHSFQRFERWLPEIVDFLTGNYHNSQDII